MNLRKLGFDARGMRAAALVGVLVIVVAAFLVGRSTKSTEDTEQAQEATVDPSVELDTRFPHSPAGASAAMATYQRALADPAILRPGVLKDRVDAIATPDYAKAMLEANQPGTDRLIAGPLGDGVRAGTPTVYLGVPIAYRVISYSPKEAEIQNYGETMIGNASTVEPAIYFGTATMVLAWQGGRWRVDSSKAAFGPTPQTRTPQIGAEGFDLGDLAGDFHPYPVAP